MQTRNAIAAVLFLSTFTLAPSAVAQGSSAGVESNIVIALKLNFPIPDVVERTPEGEVVLDEDEKPVLDYQTVYNTVKGDIRTDVEEYGSKVKAEKYGNKELLEDLLEKGGYFPEGETSIKGWSLKQVEGAEYTNVYLVKKGVAPVRVPDNVAATYFNPLQTTGKVIGKVSGAVGGLYNKASVAGGTKSRGPGQLAVTVTDSIGMYMQGTGTATVKGVYPPLVNFPVGSELPPLVELVSLKVSGIYGNGSRLGTGPFTVEGTFSLTSPVLVPDVFALPDFGAE